MKETEPIIEKYYRQHLCESFQLYETSKKQMEENENILAGPWIEKRVNEAKKEKPTEREREREK